MPRGRYPRKCLPGLIPTSDAAGEVVEIGEGVEAFEVGDRVMGTFHPRWFGGETPSTTFCLRPDQLTNSRHPRSSTAAMMR